MVFAFDISVPDLIKKLFYRYEYDIDFIDNFVSRVYQPGRKIDIELDKNSIKIKADESLNHGFFDKINNKEIFTIASIIPPVLDFKSMNVHYENKKITVDSERIPRTELTDKIIEGSTISLDRIKANIGREKSRLIELYGLTDMIVSINDEMVSADQNKRFEFKEGNFRGTISYNPKSIGGINYFVNGRYISNERLIKGIDICLFEHPFKTTITKSKTITRGDDNHALLISMMPELLRSYIVSDKARNLNNNNGNGTSYQTLLRLAYGQFPDDAGIKDAVKDNICFYDKNGKLGQNYSIDNVFENPSIELAVNEEILYFKLIEEPRITEYVSGDVECSDDLKKLQASFGLKYLFSFDKIQYTDKSITTFNNRKNFLSISQQEVTNAKNLYEIVLNVLPKVQINEDKKLGLYKRVLNALR